MLATVWQILNIMRNDRKRKFSELAETCLEKIREAITSKHIFGGFELFKPTAARHSLILLWLLMRNVAGPAERLRN